MDRSNLREFLLIEQRNQGGHANWLGNRTQQEHGVVRLRLSEVAGERRITLTDVQHGRGYQPAGVGFREGIGRFVQSFLPQRGKQRITTVAASPTAERCVSFFIRLVSVMFSQQGVAN